MVLGADPEKAHTCGVVYIYGLVTVHTCHPSLRVTAQWEFGTVEKKIQCRLGFQHRLFICARHSVTDSHADQLVVLTSGNDNDLYV